MTTPGHPDRCSCGQCAAIELEAVAEQPAAAAQLEQLEALILTARTALEDEHEHGFRMAVANMVCVSAELAYTVASW